MKNFGGLLKLVLLYLIIKLLSKVIRQRLEAFNSLASSLFYCTITKFRIIAIAILILAYIFLYVKYKKFEYKVLLKIIAKK